MSRTAFSGRPLLAGLLVAAAALGISAPAHAAQSATRTYKCKYPLIGTNPLSVKFTFDIPDAPPAGQPLAPVHIAMEATAGGNTAVGLQVVEGLTSLEGTAKLTASVATGTGTSVLVNVPLSIPKYTLPTPIPDPLVLTGSGTLPAPLNDAGNSPTVLADKFSLRLTARDQAGDPIILPLPATDINGVPIRETDQDRDWFDVSCKLDAGQDQNIFLEPRVCLPVITPYDPPTAVPLSDADVTANSVHLRWGPSPALPCGTAPTSYRITYGDKTLEVPASQTDAVISGLNASTAYSFKVEALISGGFPSRPLTVNVTTDAAPAPDSFSFDVAGAAQLKTLVKGTVPLKGSAVLRFNSQGAVIGDSLTLEPTQARLIGLGFLPVTAKLAFVSSGSASGTMAGFVPGLLLIQKVRIKVLEAKLFGAIPLAGGNNCQTKSLTTLSLQGTQFSTSQGGAVKGTFAISDLNGCGALNGLVSPAAAGGGNTISLNLTPKA